MSPHSPRVLGQLLHLQGTLHALASEVRLAEYLCAGLHRLPGVRAVGLGMGENLVHVYPRDSDASELFERLARCDSANDNDAARVNGSSVLTIHANTIFRRMANLFIALDDVASFEPYRPFVDVTANLVAILLERIDQDRELKSAQRQLEDRVAQRTRELAAANAELAEKERFIAQVMQTAPTLIYIYDLVSAKNIFSNSRIEDLLGYTPKQIAEMEEHLFRELIHPDDLTTTIANHQRTLANASDGEVCELEYRAKHVDGGWRWLRSWEGVFKRDHNGRPLQTVGVCLDVTSAKAAEAERIRLEDQLRRAAVTETIGRLAGGVAHDFNNLLVPIIGTSGLMLEDISEPNLREDIQTILDAAERARVIVRQLLAVGHREMLQVAAFSVQDLLGSCMEMIRRVVREDIDLRVDITDDRCAVEGDPKQIERILLNLVLNAQDAMPTGGVLTLRVARRELCDAGQMRPGSYAVITIQDTGGGMAPATLARATEPFFTTKAIGKGTGLGLPSAQGITEQHGGFLSIDSELGKGTTIDVFLPCVRDESVSRPTTTAPSRPPRAIGTVLLVEDDLHVRPLVRRMLERLGYHVLQACNGDEALEVSAGFGGPIHVLLSDVVMPGMNVVDMVRRLRSVRRELRVLYMSGYSQTVLNPRQIAEGTYLRKPFTVEELDEALRGNRTSAQ